jgi:phage putative head morphogenesis protein, SPP1 gp7 family
MQKTGMLQEWLAKQALEEFERQAGILGQALPDRKQLLRKVKSLVGAEFRGTTFSERVWQNQRELQQGLERTLRRTIIRGENPRVAGRELRKIVHKEFENKKYAADRIAITESARIQFDIQDEAFKEYDINQFEWVSEVDACDICADLDGQIFNVDDPNAPGIQHPFCRCTKSPYVDRGAFEDSLRSRGL